jgi:hypothetical protein
VIVRGGRPEGPRPPGPREKRPAPPAPSPRLRKSLKNAVPSPTFPAICTNSDIRESPERIRRKRCENDRVSVRYAGAHSTRLCPKAEGTERVGKASIPPLFVTFTGATAGTLFDGQTMLPLTTHCRTNRTSYEQYVLKRTAPRAADRQRHGPAVPRLLRAGLRLGGIVRALSGTPRRHRRARRDASGSRGQAPRDGGGVHRELLRSDRVADAAPARGSRRVPYAVVRARPVQLCSALDRTTRAIASTSCVGSTGFEKCNR